MDDGRRHRIDHIDDGVTVGIHERRIIARYALGLSAAALHTRVIQDPKNAVFHDFTRWETKSQLNGDELRSHQVPHSTTAHCRHAATVRPNLPDEAIRRRGKLFGGLALQEIEGGVGVLEDVRIKPAPPEGLQQLLPGDGARCVTRRTPIVVL